MKKNVEVKNIINQFKKLYYGKIKTTKNYIKVNYCNYRFDYDIKNQTTLVTCFFNREGYIENIIKDTILIKNCNNIIIFKYLFYTISFQHDETVLATKNLPIKFW